MRQDEWAKRRVAEIAQSVRWHRKRQRMSAQQLSDACAALGYPIPRSVLTNLENGYRETITTTEVDAIAAGLGIPRLLLEYPVGRVDSVEVLPGVEVSPWAAVNWAEHGRLPGLAEPDTEDALVIPEYRRHEEFEQMWEQSRRETRRIQELRQKPAAWLEEHGYHDAELRAELADHERLESRAVAMLTQIRRTLDQAGVALPAVSPSLARALGEHEDVTP